MKMEITNIQGFSDLLTHVARETNRSGEEALNYAMVMMLQAGRNATPLGKKNRPLQTFEKGQAAQAFFEGASVDDITSSAERSGRTYFDVYHQNVSQPRQVWIPRISKGRKSQAKQEAIDARDAIIKKFREIENRGTAKESWGWAMWKATGTRGKDIGKRMIRRRDPITVVKQLSGPRPFIEVQNALEWIRKICPGIEARMLKSAENRMLAQLKKGFQTGIDKAHRGASA